jgi:hypothetical protein
MSIVFRQKDFISMGMLNELRSTDFHKMIKAARKFRSQNKDKIDSFYRLDKLESETRQAQHTKTQDVYSCSKITEDVQKAKQPKTQRTKNSAQKRKDRLDRRRNDQSNSDESSVSADEQSSEAQGSASGSENESEDDPAESPQCEANDRWMDSSLELQEHESSDDVELAPAEPAEFEVSASADPCALVPATSQRLEPSQSSQAAASERFESSADSPQGAILPNSNAAAEGISSSCGRIDHDEQGHEHLADEDVSEHSDLSSSFGDVNDSDDEEGGEGLLSYPFPNPRDLTDEEAQHISPFKLSYIRYLLTKEKWESTKVHLDRPPSKREEITEPLILTRLDKKQFVLTTSKCGLFYVLYGDDGLELISVERVLWKVLGSDAENATRKSKQPPKKVCVEYTRALSTRNAIVQCKSVKDFHAKSNGGVTRTTSLGSKSLKKYLRPEAGQDSSLIFHKGDYPFETLAENIVGFVAWDPLCASERSSEDCRRLMNIINSKQAQAKVKISSLDEVDYVFCGPDFSEIDNR